MSTRVLLIRHSQPLNPCKGDPERMSGWTDFPLSSEGRRQASLLAERLRSQQRVFDAVYSSPLQRAADTAHALSMQCPRAVEFLDSLREIGCGCVDGMPIPEVQRKYAEQWQGNLLQNDEHFRWPGGESYRELRNRCIDAVRTLAGRHPRQCIAIVTHAGVISQILGSLHGLNPARWERFRPGTCSLTELEWERDMGRLLTFDDRAHLAAPKENTS